MRLVLINATLYVNLTLESGIMVSFSLFINAAEPQGPTGVLCLFVSTLTGGQDPLLFSWTPDTTGNYANTTVSNGSTSGNSWGTPTQWWTQGGAPVKGDGGTYTTALSVFNEDCGQTLILAVASDQRTQATWSSLPAALAAVSAGVAATVEGLSAASASWWWEFWSNTSFFSFDSHASAGVTALEQFSHIAGYRYASGARFTMHDLMGPWGPGGPGPVGTTYCLGPWCQFCWDMNQQVMLLLPTPSNRGALLAAPALDMFPAFLNGTWYASYGSNPPTGGTNILWWLANVHRYGLYHGDDSRLLTSLYPALSSLLKSSGLKNGTSDAHLHVTGCLSPEYPMRPATDCSYDLAIFRWASRTAMALANEAYPEDPLLPLFTDISTRLAPYPIDPNTGSYEVAAGIPFSVPHRHYSHLLALYDLYLEDAPLTLSAGLDLWFNVTCAGPQKNGPDWKGDGECRGFTQAAMSSMSARLNRTEASLGNLTAYLKLVGLPNGMYGEEVYAGHPDEFSPVSESAYSAAASLYGLLLASFPINQGVPQSGLFNASLVSSPRVWSLRVWPAAPWENATMFRLRGEGALLVSSVRVNGATPWIAVEADTLIGGGGAGSPVLFTIFCPDWTTVQAVGFVSASTGVSVTPVKGLPGTWLVENLSRGDAVALFPAGFQPNDLSVGVASGRNASGAFLCFRPLLFFFTFFRVLSFTNHNFLHTHSCVHRV